MKTALIFIVVIAIIGWLANEAEKLVRLIVRSIEDLDERTEEIEKHLGIRSSDNKINK